MINNHEVTLEPKAQMALLKQQYAMEAKFISKEHFPFNAFDDAWTLNGLGNNGQNVDMAWLRSSKLSLDDQIIVRLSLAGMATRLAKVSIDNVIGSLRNLDLSELSFASFKALWPTLIASTKVPLKQFIRGLYAHDYKRFEAFYAWSIGQSIDKASVNVYHPEKGALSDLENQAFNVSMNQKSDALMARGFDVIDLRRETRENKGLGLLSQCRNFIAARFEQVLARRPTNLIQLKWSDFSADAAIFTGQEQALFSDDDELKLRMFKAKQGGTFRQYPESEPLILNNAISKEVLYYRNGYYKLFVSTLAAQKLSLNDEELHTLFLRLPVFFTDVLFKTAFNDKTQLFSAFSEQGGGFHIANNTLGKSINNLFDALNIVSERVGSRFKVGNNRIRHTIGSKADRDNIHYIKIAKILGNTPQSALIYVDLTDENRVLIDQNFSKNDFLAKAFATSVSTLLKSGEIALENDFGDAVGKSKGIKQCLGCQRKKPLGCYGCNNFSALATGDHRSQKVDAQKIYDYRLKSGDAPQALFELEKQIRYIEATILVCDQVLQQQTALGEPS